MEFDIFTRQDMSYGSLIRPVNILNEYNTILIPTSFNFSYNFNDTIHILHNNKKINLTIVLAKNTINLLDIEYQFAHFAPGITLENFSNTQLIINSQIIPLYYNIDSNESCKLINGLLVLNNNYYNNFNNFDKIQLYLDNKIMHGTAIYKQNKYNMYQANTFNTILHILPLKENLNIIYELNNYKNKFKQCRVNSLTTLLNDQKGSIVIKSKNKTQKYGIKCSGVDNNYYGEYYISDRIEIKNLNKGKYNLEFLDPDSRIICNKYAEITNFID